MPARLSALSSSRKPNGSTRCRVVWVAAQSRAIAPVLGGISGSTRAICRRCLADMILGGLVRRIIYTNEAEAAGRSGGGGFGAGAGAQDFSKIVNGDLAQADPRQSANEIADHAVEI